MTDVTLRECPFCGGEAMRWDRGEDSHQHAVVCERCRANTNWCPTEEAADVAWDTRVPDPAAEARIAELEAEVAEHRRHVATVMQREDAANKRVRELEAEVAALKAPKTYHYHDVDDFYKPETCERCKWFNDHDIMWCDREGGPGTSTGTREAPSCDKWEGKEDS